ncbi:aldehyde dehydrogenase family protein [Salmonella enterica subsp. enterica]|nr:aldehyde dehydrogenase family protein [Salmonella enterica subsp. enterica]
MVVGIVPQDFSIMIAIWKLAAALVCGCTIVIKPSEYTREHCCESLSWLKGRFPDGVLTW